MSEGECVRVNESSLFMTNVSSWTLALKLIIYFSWKESRTRFEAFVQSGTVLNNYAHIFELLMRMRQAVNHPWLVTHRGETSEVVDDCSDYLLVIKQSIIVFFKYLYRLHMRCYIDC